MKKTVRKRFLRGLMVCVLCFFTAACGKEGDDPEQGLTLSGERFSLSGEGESVRVRVAAGNGEWKIVSVSARDGAQRIWGNVFDAAGNLLRDNVMLALDGPGRLESVWSDHGFGLRGPAPTSS